MLDNPNPDVSIIPPKKKTTSKPFLFIFEKISKRVISHSKKNI